MRKFLQSLKAGFAGLLLQSKQKIALKFKHMYKNLFDFVMSYPIFWFVLLWLMILALFTTYSTYSV